MVLRTPAIALLVMVLALPAMAQSTAKPDADFVSVQPADQWLASRFIGQPVTNTAGETIGDINDLLVDRNGRVANVVIGIGGFLGIGEKSVAVPLDSLTITSGADGKRLVQIGASTERLRAAPSFVPAEKTAYMRASERAAEIGQKAADKAREITGEAARKIEDMRGGHKAD